MSVTAAKGFRAAGVTAGLKSSGRDVALVVNDGPQQAAAGVFTTNRVQAAPVRWTRQVLADGELHAVLLNSGGANACTGPAGFQDTHASAEAVAGALGAGAGEIAVASTGLIGVRLPMDRLLVGIAKAVADLSATGGADAADAIRTTDSVPKQASRSTGGWTVGGMAKGAGMLAPSLATMLSVITTDAVADADTLQRLLTGTAARTFGRVDADGCLSTNDTVLLLASGASGVRPEEGELEQALYEVCDDLAGQLIADAEGASKQVLVEVVQAVTEADALEVARAVARNNLLKCALFGADPNWGRVLAAVGTTGAAFDPDSLDVTMNGIQVCRSGAPGDDRSGVDLTGPAVTITVDLHAGGASAAIRTTDLTTGYVHENSAYST